MTGGDAAAGNEHLRTRLLAFIREVAPFAYCDACLALRLSAALTETTLALGELTSGQGGLLERTRRVCYGCARTLTISALRDGVSLR
jgi:hypothetical protein